MTEDTNLLMDSLDSSKAQEQPAIASDTDEAATEAAETSPGEQEGAQGVRLVFLGEEIELPLKEAARWAQKGMNAEHALDKYKNAPEQELIGFYSALFGMERGEFLDSLTKDMLKAQTELELARLKESNPDMPNHLRLHAARLGAERRLKEYEEAQRGKRAAEEANKLHPWKALAEKYPELVSQSELPEEVQKEIDGGRTPLEAMLGYELKKANSELERLKAALEVAQTNGKNHFRTTGSAASFGGDTIKDPFLLGITGE